MDRENASPPTEPRLDAECKRLLDELRRRCPHLLPADPRPAGDVAPIIPAADRDLGALVTAAAREAATGRLPADSTRLPGRVLWEDGPDALLLDLDTITVEIGEGTVVVRVDVICDQLDGRALPIGVTFVVGTPDRPTGLLAATPRTPIGPPVVVARWGDELVAFAWQALLDAIGALAAGAGMDRDGTALIPTAVTARPGELQLQPQARHGMDRVRTGSVVRRSVP